MQLRTAMLIKAYARGGTARWNSAVQLLQPAITAYNLSGVAGSLLAVAGLLTAAAHRQLIAALRSGG